VAADLVSALVQAGGVHGGALDEAGWRVLGEQVRPIFCSTGAAA
jgi:hypothetical protein